MNKILKPDELDKIPEDGIDYRNFILHVASNNNWVFDLSEYSTAIVNAKKGALGRVSTTLKELEDDRFLIKRSGSRVYEVTTKGIKYYNSGTTKESKRDNVDLQNNVIQINAQQLVYSDGGITAPISQVNNQYLSSIENKIVTHNKPPQKSFIEMLISSKTIILIVIAGLGGLLAHFLIKLF